MTTMMEKDEAHRLIDRMPPGATWDDLMREYTFVKQLSMDWPTVMQAGSRM